MKKSENIKDQITVVLLLAAATLGASNKGNLSEDFITDCLYAFNTMNFDVVETIGIKLSKGEYGRIKKNE